jgi:hypothetical protein
MTNERLGARRETHFRVNSEIAAMSNAEIRALLSAGETSPGWGTHQTVDVGGAKVFVKSVPVTELEYANAFSTRNLYDMPLYYNYGVGSAGFGVFRELLTHIATTTWVLEGTTPYFPLLYQFRLLPFEGERAVIDSQRRDGYVRYWGGSEAIGRYFDERMKAKHDLVLFLEHVPHTLGSWLVEHPDRCEGALEDLRKAITFLRAQGIVHFDAHFFNILSDGEQAYVTDFGLALARRFDLRADERQFLAVHEYYDYGEVLWSLGYLLVEMYQKLSEQERLTILSTCGVRHGTPPREMLSVLARSIEQLVEPMRLHPGVVAPVRKYRDVIVLMDEFYLSMNRNNGKDTRLDLPRLRAMLEDLGFGG